MFLHLSLLFLHLHAQSSSFFLNSGSAFSLIAGTDSPSGFRQLNLNHSLLNKSHFEKNISWGAYSGPSGPPEITKKHISLLRSSAVLLLQQRQMKAALGVVGRRKLDNVPMKHS